MLPTSQRMTTDSEPMKSILALASEIKSRRSVLNVTVAGGFPPANTPDAGFSVLVTTDNDQSLAESAAVELARFAWDRREQFLGGVSSWHDAAEAIRGNSDGPLVLVDIGDNPWTGGPGDSVELLRFLIDEKISGAALASVVDPKAVQRCIAAGPGARSGWHWEGTSMVVMVSQFRSRGTSASSQTDITVIDGPMHAGGGVNLGPSAYWMSMASRCS